ncbi:hypothetical protein X941_2799 [Burkholderia pseudomallei MSHR5569]|nr:hypothetical protein X941_2799 [Burkholderia pseudomallei MSHR5569]
MDFRIRATSTSNHDQHDSSQHEIRRGTVTVFTSSPSASSLSLDFPGFFKSDRQLSRILP